jgi:hypothetical protein
MRPQHLTVPIEDHDHRTAPMQVHTHVTACHEALERPVLARMGALMASLDVPAQV